MNDILNSVKLLFFQNYSQMVIIYHLGCGGGGGGRGGGEGLLGKGRLIKNELPGGCLFSRDGGLKMSWRGSLTELLQ